MYTMTKYDMYSSVILGTCYIRIQVEDIYSCTPSAPFLFLIATTNQCQLETHNVIHSTTLHSQQLGGSSHHESVRISNWSLQRSLHLTWLVSTLKCHPVPDRDAKSEGKNTLPSSLEERKVNCLMQRTCTSLFSSADPFQYSCLIAWIAWQANDHAV